MKKTIILTLAAGIFFCCQSGPQQQLRKSQPAGAAKTFFQDKATWKRVDSLLKLMTLEEKIGQMVQYPARYTPKKGEKTIEEMVREGQCGSFFNMHETERTRELQRIAVEETRLGIPALVAFDAIHGYKTIFPINLGMAASWNLDAIGQSARICAREASASGGMWTFSPMCDIARDPRWGRASEGSGEDPYLGSKIAAAMVEGYQGNDLSADTTMLACVKHFAAYGAPEAGRDYNTVEISERSFRDNYLPPYIAAFNAGAATTMTAFNDIDGMPCVANKNLLKNILRDEIGFNGFIVSDWNAIHELIMHGVAADTLQSTTMAISAGVNMDMLSGSYRKCLADLVRSSKVKESTIDKLCGEILYMKFALGLFEDPYQYWNEEKLAEYQKSEEHWNFSRQIARESMVLLQNELDALPIAQGKRIALIGPFVDDRDVLLASWRAAGQADTIPSIADAFCERFGEKNVRIAQGCQWNNLDRSSRDFRLAINAARSSDVVVMVAGHPARWSGEDASLTSIQLPQAQRDLLAELKRTRRPIVLVLIAGRPLDLSWETEQCDAILMAWYPGSNGARAVSDIVSGDFNPQGKITMTFPRNLGQVPIHYDHKMTGRPLLPESPRSWSSASKYLDSPNTPLFPFGYGLSYTTYAYSNIRIKADKIKTGESATVSVDVKNTGNRVGTEIVQLYLRDVVASVVRPVRMLKGFERVQLEPGETKTVSFTITPEDMSFYRDDFSWGTEPGRFDVWVGGNSDASLQTSFELVK